MAEPIRKLGRFELLKCIAKGGMGEIYLARQRGTAGFEKNVIIKTILPHLSEEEEFVEKFLDEGRIVVQLIHGNIVPVFDMDEENGEYYIAMEYIPGRDLRDIQKRLDVKNEKMPIEYALFIIQELCKGLDYAHRKTDERGEPLDIVHRDVSPSNILVSSEGEVKIIDFGIARAASRIGKTVSGRIQGKFCYMSPEQASGQSLDGRSDLFSVGVILYELLTGFRPFEADSDLGTLDLVRKCDFDPPSTLIPSIPSEVDDIVTKALSKDPNGRFSSADQFQVAILQYLYRGGGAGPTSNDVAEFMSSLFPDGLERDELRSARDSSPPKKLSLDEAMDLELEKLADPDIDPLNTTAISASDVLRPKITSTGANTDDEKTPAGAPLDTRKAPGTKRGIGLGIGIGIFATLAASIYIATADSSEGSVLIESTPPHAEIEVDGATIPGARTPFTATLPIGTHDIRLFADGYEARVFKVEIKGDEEIVLAGADAVLNELGPPEPKKFKVETSPNDARLSANGVEFGTGSGVLTVNPDEEILVEATRDGCTPRKVHLKHAFASETLQITLTCEEAGSTNGAPNESLAKEKPHQKNGVRRITIRTSPPGASIVLNGQSVGKSPVTRPFKPNDILKIKATMEGYATMSVERKASTIKNGLNLKLQSAEMGCLNLRLGFPAVARVAIDGTFLPGEIGRLKNHPLSAGTHTIRAKNDTMGKDETVSVEIKPGSGCALKVIWPRN